MQTQVKSGLSIAPCPPMGHAPREWKLACPKLGTGKKDADGEPLKSQVWFSRNGLGQVESHSNLGRSSTSLRNFDFILVSVGILGL